MLVKEQLAKSGIAYHSIELGEVVVPDDITAAQLHELAGLLLKTGLELMDDKKSILIQRIKNVIIETVHHSEEQSIYKFSELLSRTLGHDYTYMSNLFSAVQGTTIEQFHIAHKIEKVKELLVYGQVSLTTIASNLHYSSVAHLSAQFKKVTGLTPSHFKKLRTMRRSMLDEL